ncbi:MAG: hypothetical protein KatS3mg102_2963 [Planctomycetota bacterium]|nr:MAG: hypothetical protein KatS3mg102_2963 [Planctomycetota bacterium]
MEDPLGEDSFLNPKPARGAQPGAAREEQGGGESSSAALRPGDSEENVYALLDDRPEEATPQYFGPDEPGEQLGASSGGSGAMARAALLDEVEAGAASGASPRAPAPPPVPAAAPQTASFGGAPPAPFPAGRPGPRAEPGRRPSGEAPLRLHADEESSRRLRERISERQRQQARASGGRQRRAVVLAIIGGLLVLGSVAGVLLRPQVQPAERAAGTEAAAAGAAAPAGPEPEPGPAARSVPSVLSIEWRLRRALAFGLPIESLRSAEPAPGDAR